MDGLLMGPGTPYVITDINEGGRPEFLSGDRVRPREDGIHFGKDRIGGRVYSIQGSVDTASETLGRAAWAALSKKWNSPDSRRTPGRVVELRVRQHDGATRIVYGRPRRIDPANQVLLAVGRIDFVLDFQCIDHLFYGDQEFSNMVTIIPPITGSLTFPAVFPINTHGAATVQSDVTILGDDDAWIVTEFHGPILNPVIDVPGSWAAEVGMDLDFSQTLKIDPRPGFRGVYLNGVAIPSGVLSSSSPRLSNMKLAPGEHNLILRGYDATGTATMNNSWRNTYLTP
jgi:hypothetical protein